MKCVIA